MFIEILRNKDITISECSKQSGIPRSTIADLAKGKTRIENISAGNLFKLSKCFGTTMNEMMEYCSLPSCDSDIDFMKAEESKITENGLSAYVDYILSNNLIETCHIFNDKRRFVKYMEAIGELYRHNQSNIPDNILYFIEYLPKETQAKFFSNNINETSSLASAIKQFNAHNKSKQQMNTLSDYSDAICNERLNRYENIN